MSKIQQITIGQRIGVGRGFIHVKNIHNSNPEDVWVEITGKKRIDAKKSFDISVPDDLLIDLLRVEALEKKYEAAAERARYWEQKDKNKEPVFNRLNAQIEDLKASNQELLAGKNYEENRVRTLASDVQTLQQLNKNLESEITVLNEAIENAQFLQKSNGFLAWSGWILFGLGCLIALTKSFLL
jgi:hypothetical protein